MIAIFVQHWIPNVLLICQYLLTAQKHFGGKDVINAPAVSYFAIGLYTFPLLLTAFVCASAKKGKLNFKHSYISSL